MYCTLIALSSENRYDVSGVISSTVSYNPIRYYIFPVAEIE